MTATSLAPATGVVDGCPRCGTAIDSLPFDASNLVRWQGVTREEVLARFDLPPQYCGILEWVVQYTSAYAADPTRILTPSVEWRLTIDRNPIAPYARLGWLVNPWGACAPIAGIRLPPGARVELIARRVPGQADDPGLVGGRLAGRYWYDPSFAAPRGVPRE